MDSGGFWDEGRIARLRDTAAPAKLFASLANYHRYGVKKTVTKKSNGKKSNRFIILKEISKFKPKPDIIFRL